MCSDYFPSDHEPRRNRGRPLRPPPGFGSRGLARRPRQGPVTWEAGRDLEPVRMPERRAAGGCGGGAAERLAGRFGRAVWRLAGTSQQVHELTELVARVQATVTTGRRIAVVGVRPGVGTSTVAALTAMALAHYRRDRVMGVDADPVPGALPQRLAVAGDAPSLADLGRTGSRLAGFEEIRDLLARTRGGLWVLSGHGARELPAASYQTGMSLLGRFFAVTVTDCGAGPGDEITRTVLGSSHAQILVTDATAEGAAYARQVLEQAYHGGGRTLVAFVAQAPGRLDLAQAARLLPGDVGTVMVGYDRQLAQAAPIVARNLTESASTAATQMAAAVLARALGAA
jgi:MinD-like ATPase involved in chromosome partitioning or flagellar assembly